MYIILNVYKQMTVKLWLLYRNTWNYLTICKQMDSGLFKIVINRMCLQIIQMYKQYLALNNL